MTTPGDMLRAPKDMLRGENLRDLLYDGADPHYEFSTPIERLHQNTQCRRTRAICRVYLGLPLCEWDRDMLGITYTPEMAAADLDDLLEDIR